MTQRDSNPWPLRCRCSALTNWAMKSHSGEQVNLLGSCFPVESPEFFRFMRQLLKLSSKCEDHIFTWFQTPALHITFLSYDNPFTGKHEPNKLTCSPLCDFIAQLVRALHRQRRGHGFESRWVTWIFQVHETLLKLSSKCEDHIFT